MKKTFLFCHGFGFDQGFWNELKIHFRGHSCQYWDLGYFGDKSTTYPDIDGDIIAIGHSVGFLKLLLQAHKFKYLIGLQGFINFVGRNDLERKQELTLFKRMLKTAPSRTLAQFYKRSGAVPDNIKLKLTKLQKNQILADFQYLAGHYPLPSDKPIMIIGATNDVVLPPAIIYDNFADKDNVRIEMLKDGQHALGFLHPRKVFELIIDFVIQTSITKENRQKFVNSPR